MAEKLIIVMANTDTRNGEELGAPIFQATVAAAMEFEVDVIFASRGGRGTDLLVGHVDIPGIGSYKRGTGSNSSGGFDNGAKRLTSRS